MTITITFTNGDVVQYTNCSDTSIVDGVLTFTGTNAAGQQVSVSINWATVQIMEKQPTG